MPVETFVCHKCWITFKNQSALKNHTRRKHQLEVKAQLKDGTVIHVKREADGSFPCPCGSRRFLYPLSLQTHAKKCIGQAAMTATMTEDRMSTIELGSEGDVTLEPMSTEPEGEIQEFRVMN